MPGSDEPAPSRGNDEPRQETTSNLVVPFHDDDAPLGLPAANAAFASADSPADEDVAVVVALDGGGHGEAAPRVAAWMADCQHDRAWREAMVQKMLQGGHVISAEETALIAKGLALFDDFGAARGKVRSLKQSKTIVYARTKQDKRSGLLIGQAEAVIRTSPEQIIAYLMHYDSKHRLSQLRLDFDVRHDVVEVKNLHHMVISDERKTAPFENRCFLQANLWRKVSDAPLVYVWLTVPIEHHDKVPPASEAHAVRAKAIRCLRATRISDDVSKVELACSLDLRGTFPTWLTNLVAIPNLCNQPYDLQSYFLQIRPPSDCSVGDGTCLGNLLVDVAEAAKKPDQASAIRIFVERTAMLRECGCANLSDMLIGALGTQTFSVRPKDVLTADPAALTAAEAEAIGRGLECIVRLSTTHTEAVDDLLRKYPALAVTGQRHVWFRAMLEAIAKRRMASAPFGLKLRLGIGAGVSMADMFSDVCNIVNMLQSGQIMGAYGLIGLIGASLAMQVLLCVIQSKHLGRKAVAWEVFLVLSLAKPGVDAVRVGSGSEQIAGAPLDPYSEMMFCKASELAFESGAGAALQAAIVLSGYWSTAAVVSVGISCLATGFLTAMLTFEWDTSPAKRKKVANLLL